VWYRLQYIKKYEEMEKIQIIGGGGVSSVNWCKNITAQIQTGPVAYLLLGELGDPPPGRIGCKIFERVMLKHSSDYEFELK